jgi:hypothetical protein
MPRFLSNILASTSRKDTAPVNRHEGFQGNGAVVLRDRRGTVKAGFPDTETKAFGMGGDPLADERGEKALGNATVSADRARSSFPRNQQAGLIRRTALYGSVCLVVCGPARCDWKRGEHRGASPSATSPK